MIVLLNVSRAPNNKRLLKADFHNLSQVTTKLGKSFKEITASPIDLVPKVLEELKSTKNQLRVHYCAPEVQANVQELLLKSLMFYYRAALPEHCSVIKIFKDPNNKNSVTALYYDSELEASKDLAAAQEESGSPIDVAIKILDHLNNGYWHPAKLEFEDEIKPDIKTLFSKIIDVYNQSVKDNVKEELS